jgi:polyketide cyclase/dehydrase/lipid transport protein
MTEPKHHVYHSAVLDADVDTVWPVMRDILQVVEISFGSAVKNVKWKQGSSVAKVPAQYRFTLLPPGDVINEEVVARSEHERSLTYRTIGQALSLVDYVATYRVLPVTNDGRSFLEWSREFRVVEDAEPDFLDGFLTLLEQEIAAVKAHFAA